MPDLFPTLTPKVIVTRGSEAARHSAECLTCAAHDEDWSYENGVISDVKEQAVWHRGAHRGAFRKQEALSAGPCDECGAAAGEVCQPYCLSAPGANK